MVTATSSRTQRRLGGKGFRLVTLVFATIVGLSAGTNYLYSAYAPQLASRLALSSTQLNVIGSAGNLVLVIRNIYVGGEDGLFSTIGVAGLALIEMLTGIGSTAAMTAAGNAVALSFKKTRATALSLVLSGFGLSASFYSNIWRGLPPTTSDPTAALLLLLALGCGASMALGAITIERPVTGLPVKAAPASPPSIVVNPQPADDSDDEADTIAAGLFPSERTPLVRSNLSKSVHDEVICVSGWALAKELDFWLLFTYNGLCSSCGLMYINNVGTLIRTLAQSPSVHEQPPWHVAVQQANLVSLLSVFNCLGRLLTGILSDYMLHRAPEKWRFSRIWWNVSTAVVLVAAQSTVSHASTIDGLWTGLTFPTILAGFAHGSFFGISGIIGLERFGINHFSGNNGVLALAPAIFGQATNLMFGKIYDHQASRSSEHHSLLATSTCTLGRDCYLLSFRITTMMAVLALGLSLVLSNRLNMKRRAA